MTERLLRGVPASPGTAFGTSWRRPKAVRGAALVAWEDHDREREAARAALAEAARELSAVAAALPPPEAQIIEAGVLMAADPALVRSVEEAILAQGLPAADAILLATGEHADAISAVDDETLAARADDVKSLGQRAARLAAGAATEPPSRTDLVVIADDLGPADVAELSPALAGIALAGGGATAHAAIVARSLGIPMVTGLGTPVLSVADGTPMALDGTAGSLTVEPSAVRSRAAAAEMNARRLASQHAHARRDQPAITSDGRRITVLANVATPAELDVGLRYGAEGIGLLRTELAFLDALDWPTEQQHTDVLQPILSGADGRPAVVRVLDFGADKSPPFLRGVGERGLALLLRYPDAFVCQLRALLLCSHDRDVRILLPMVERPEQIVATRALLEHAAEQLGVVAIPPLGAMIETPGAAENAPAIAEQTNFLSIGTNDLTAAMLGADRFAENAARAYDPRVLRSIARSVSAAHAAAIAIEVCGEAASDPVMLPLLVGLGVDEVSVGAARVGEVRQWIRELVASSAERVAGAALEMGTADQVAAAARPLSGGVHALSV